MKQIYLMNNQTLQSIGQTRLLLSIVFGVTDKRRQIEPFGILDKRANFRASPTPTEALELNRQHCWRLVNGEALKRRRQLFASLAAIRIVASKQFRSGVFAQSFFECASAQFETQVEKRVKRV